MINFYGSSGAFGLEVWLFFCLVPSEEVSGYIRININNDISITETIELLFPDWLFFFGSWDIHSKQQESKDFPVAIGFTVHSLDHPFVKHMRQSTAPLTSKFGLNASWSLGVNSDIKLWKGAMQWNDHVLIHSQRLRLSNSFIVWFQFHLESCGITLFQSFLCVGLQTLHY